MVGVGVWALCQNLSALTLFLFDSSPAASFFQAFQVSATFLIYFLYASQFVSVWESEFVHGCVHSVSKFKTLALRGSSCISTVAAPVHAAVAPFVLFVNQLHSVGWKCDLIHFLKKAWFCIPGGYDRSIARLSSVLAFQRRHHQRCAISEPEHKPAHQNICCL